MAGRRPTIGELDQRVTIEQPTLVDDSSGTGKDRTWSTLAKVWARVTPVSGSERVLGAQVESPTLYRVVIRRRADVTAHMRVLWITKSMNIKAVVDPGPREAFMTLDCEAGVAS